MRLPTLTLIGALGLAGAAVSAQAAPLTPAPDIRNTPNIVRVADGCGWGNHYVPGHWSRWRGEWVPPHCAPNGPGYYNGGYPALSR